MQEKKKKGFELFLILFPGWEKDKNNAVGGPELKTSFLGFFSPFLLSPTASRLRHQIKLLPYRLAAAG